MTLKTVFDYENLDLTADLNAHFAHLASRGVISGGTLTYSAPNAIVSSCYAMSYDGMLVSSDTTVSVLCASGYVNYVVLRAKHSSAGASTLRFESLTAANYATDPDKDYLIVFGTVDLTGTTSISYAVRDGVDVLSRSQFLGVYANLTTLAIAWPATTPVLQKTNDFVLLIDDSNNSDYPSFYYWDGSSWTSAVASGAGTASALSTHIGAITTTGTVAHNTSDQHAALIGTVGTPSSTNKFVTATDTNLLLTSDERAATLTANVESMESVSVAPSATNPFVVNAIPVCISRAQPLPANGTNYVSLSRLVAGADLYVGLLGLDSGDHSTARQFFQAEDAYGNGYSDSDGALCVIDVQDSSGATLNPSTNSDVSNLGYWAPSSVYNVLRIVFNRVVTSGNSVYVRYNAKGTISKLAPVEYVVHGIASTGHRNFFESYKIVTTLEATSGIVSDGTLSATGAVSFSSTLAVTGATTCAALTSSSTITATRYLTSTTSTASAPGYVTGTESGLYGALDGTSVSLSCNGTVIMAYDSSTSTLSLSATTVSIVGTLSLGALSATTITTTGKITAEYAEMGSSLWNSSLAWFGNKSQIGDAYTEHGSGLLVDTTGTVCLTSKSTTFKFGNTSLNSIAVSIAYVNSWSTSISGAFSVTGAASITGTLSATGAVSFTNTLSVSGNTTSARFLSSLTSVAASPTFAIVSSTGLYGSSSTVGLSIGGTSFLSIDAETSLTTLTGDMTVTGTTTLSGATTLSSTLALTGAATFSGTLTVTGATTLSSTLVVTGTTTLSGGIIGVIDGSDPVDGHVGELKDHSVTTDSPRAITNGASMSVNSISLTAGDWDVEGMANFKITNVTISYTDAPWLISISTDTPESWTIGPTTSLIGFSYSNATANISLIPTRIRVSIHTTTTVNINVIANFTGGTVTSFGYMSARRVR